MKIQLKKLILKDFKGIKNLEIDFSEKTNISGDNATGKTTIFDAYSWLLWGKDSLNRKDYEIKPYDVNNEVVHNLESSVVGIFDIDGKEIKFERIYKEVWSKKRGSNIETFTGNTTDFLINDVPKKKKEYEDEIGKIVSEDESNLLSNPLYFNTILDKKERRSILLSLVKDVNIDDVKEANKELEKLDLSNYTIEEIQAMAKASCKKINDKLKEIPARIDELEKTKTTEDFAELEKEKESLKKEIEDLDKKLVGSRNISEEVDKRYKQILELKSQIVKINSEFEDGKKEKIKDLEEAALDIGRKITMGQFEINNIRKSNELLESDLKAKTESLNRNKKNLSDMRIKWGEIQKKKFDGSLSCPTCGKEFDEDKKEEVLKHFNLEKSRQLEMISESGKEINKSVSFFNEQIEALDKTIKEEEAKVEKLSKALEKHMQDREKIQGQIEKVKSLILCDKKKEEIKSLEESIKTIEKEIASIGKEDNTQILSQKQAYNERLEEVNSKLSNQGLNAELDKKIKKYMEEEKELGKEFEIQQEKLYLCDEYIKTYTHLVSDKINALFTKVEFKLFDTQINGGVVETAEATYKGVPYGSLNSAAQINAGLDVINSLSKHYEKEIPIFVDNAESVNELVKTESQLITLTVNKLKILQIENL
ncbi:AAA family ATPase [Anaerococcus sp. Marseille-P3915]|uniref:AAA family ATPase n=1 Tax=Anaerococcus sp. Marseille-P3915 TaxID=2057799 RepID=UPI000D0BCD1E|nr:AAA family ATPase [Anaerococcus sp. Marseille-P3915]